jgi:hypothetical protein
MHRMRAIDRQNIVPRAARNKDTGRAGFLDAGTRTEAVTLGIRKGLILL